MSSHTPDIESVIRSLADKFESVFRLGDVQGIAEFYTDNGMLLPAGADFIRGGKDIAAYWRSALDMGIAAISLELLEVERHGDTAIEISRYTLRDADNQVVDRGKGMVIWKQADEVWKMHRDIWTSSVVAL